MRHRTQSKGCVRKARVGPSCLGHIPATPWGWGFLRVGNSTVKSEQGLASSPWPSETPAAHAEADMGLQGACEVGLT